MAIDSMLKLAEKIEKKLKTAVNSSVDLLDPYTGEDSSDAEKLQSASKAILGDLESIASQYYMYESQAQQAQRELTHQRYLLYFAKKLQGLIEDSAKRGQVNIPELRNGVYAIRQEAAQASKQIGMRISLSELQSLRLLHAYIEDDNAKSSPRPEPINWAELARRYRGEGAREELSRTMPSPGAKPAPAQVSEDEVTETV